ncbi:DUF5606 domain-containing protein [uncultured Chitinophaga sp.]|uniref:DUF5606 family protein n=1 Tax=uncultured Chitinophaga sp. TaxID=339340 RepID=UPI0025FEF342|nr:DUF5606 domain-containing protein [uncultured Chitinophaga sp.]
MQYREIVAVTGLGGLFQLVASKQDGAIVRSLEDKSTRFVSSRVHNFTPLESIEVFTTGDNVNLALVFKAMQENESQAAPIEPKSDNNSIKAYFKSVFPEFDEERVYVSDMKKMLKWYGILKQNELLKFDEILAEEGEEVAVEEAAPAAEVAEEAKPKAKAKAKKAAADVEGEVAEGAEEKPKKAKAPKKVAAEGAEGEEAPKAKKATKKKAEE